MRSPLFSEHFAQDNWALLFFDALRQAFTKTKAATPVEALLGKKKSAGAGPPQHELKEDQDLLDFGANAAAQEPAETVAEDLLSVA
jgi:hypothetical protein